MGIIILKYHSHCIIIYIWHWLSLLTLQLEYNMENYTLIKNVLTSPINSNEIATAIMLS